MLILAVESSCDETAVALVRDGREVLTDCISSQVELHRIYGGVVPEIASRKHIECIYALADQALARRHYPLFRRRVLRAELGCAEPQEEGLTCPLLHATIVPTEYRVDRKE